MEQELLKKTIEFHGHLCPGIAFGYRASLLALKKLDVNTNEMKRDYMAIAENSLCGLDAIQYILGLTIGNDGLLVEDCGKQAFSFLSKKTWEGIRIILKIPLWESLEPLTLHEKVKLNKASMDERKRFIALRSKRGKEILEIPDDELFCIKNIRRLVPGKVRLFPTVMCGECKEDIMIPWVKQTSEGYLCKNCQSDF